MASPVEATLILADAAQAAGGGKVSMLGAGWSVTGSPTAPSAVVALIKVPWDRANQKIAVQLRLLDEDGQPIFVESDDQGRQKLEFEAELEVGRPPGLKHGTPLDASFAATIPPLPLAPGRYSWVLEIAGTTEAAPFQVVLPPPQA